MPTPYPRVSGLPLRHLLLLLSLILAAGSSVRAAPDFMLVPALGSTVEPGEWEYAVVLSPGAFQLYYRQSRSLGAIEACMEATSSGWVALGFGTPGQDIVAGWHDGTGQVHDLVGHPNPREDAVASDVTLLTSDETSGITTICWSRALDTGRSEDIAVAWQGTQPIAWAYAGPGAADPASVDDMLTHETLGASGVFQMTWLDHKQAVVPLGSLVDVADWSYGVALERDLVHLFYNIPRESHEDTVSLCVTARHNSWLGLGWHGTHRDLIGYFNASAQAVVRDWHGNPSPSEDTLNHWTLDQAQDDGGVLTFCVSRAVTTGDAQDAAFPVSSAVQWTWAMGAESSDVISPHGAVVGVDVGYRTFRMDDPVHRLPVPALGSTSQSHATWNYAYRLARNNVHLFYNLDGKPGRETVRFCVEGRGDGWVGVGFLEPGTDYLVGWRSGGGSQVLADYHDHPSLALDASQDVSDATVYAEAGVTTVCGSRSVDTKDADDAVLDTTQPQRINWAFSDTDPAGTDSVMAHTQRGYATLMLRQDFVPPEPADQPLDLERFLAIALGVILVLIFIAAYAIDSRQKRNVQVQRTWELIADSEINDNLREARRNARRLSNATPYGRDERAEYASYASGGSRGGNKRASMSMSSTGNRSSGVNKRASTSMSSTGSGGGKERRQSAKLSTGSRGKGSKGSRGSASKQRHSYGSSRSKGSKGSRVRKHQRQRSTGSYGSSVSFTEPGDVVERRGKRSRTPADEQRELARKQMERGEGAVLRSASVEQDSEMPDDTTDAVTLPSGKLPASASSGKRSSGKRSHGHRKKTAEPGEDRSRARSAGSRGSGGRRRKHKSSGGTHR